ncbi:MAG TPA: type II toxin-antitoxin system HicA family toxin [Chloroflexota bacterium]|nr:type II toxin-antitoxin system HicA family toxin [Chloroflexota bacterium]
MPHIGPISRRDLIRYLRQLGFDGPIAGTRHEYMERLGRRVRIPNPHRSELRSGLLAEVLRQAGISREEWEDL